MNYCIIDESDANDCFECEGDVLNTFFKSSGLFGTRDNLVSIRKGGDIEKRIKTFKKQHFNIVQFSAHGTYTPRTKTKLASSSIIRRIGNKETEIFRPDSIVRTGLKADLFLSTNCQTFNSQFIDTLRHYKGISNFIAPVNSPYIGDTLIFAMMFYNELLPESGQSISNQSIIRSFKRASSAFSLYANNSFRLYSTLINKIY